MNRTTAAAIGWVLGITISALLLLPAVLWLGITVAVVVLVTIMSILQIAETYG